MAVAEVRSVSSSSCACISCSVVCERAADMAALTALAGASLSSLSLMDFSKAPMNLSEKPATLSCSRCASSNFFFPSSVWNSEIPRMERTVGMNVLKFILKKFN
ncbi:MAG: hypothetical protein NC311_13135 [Muribaculaceae bacterium]|nr:hypothetical protein [Muribaculaceae bacterium]